MSSQPAPQATPEDMFRFGIWTVGRRAAEMFKIETARP